MKRPASRIDPGLALVSLAFLTHDPFAAGRGGVMRKLQDYRQHAEECRAIARKTASPEQREQLLKMAETWDALASERERRNNLDRS